MKNICSNCDAENRLDSKYCSACGYTLPLLTKQEVKSESEQPKETKSKRKLTPQKLIGIVTMIIAANFGARFSQSLFEKPSFDKQLTEFASEMNKTCPFTIDKHTTLKNVVPLSNKTIQYNYILVDIVKTEVNLDTVKKYVFPGVLQNIKNNPGLKLFRDNKITFNYNYSDKNGDFVTEYIVKPEMYE